MQEQFAAGRSERQICSGATSTVKPIERGLQDDLAAQAAGRPAVEDAAEHPVLLGIGRRQHFRPLRVDVNVARRAGACTAAFRDDTPDVVVDGGLHERGAGWGVDDLRRAVRLDIGHPRHGGSGAPPGQYAYAFELPETSAGRL